MSKTVVVLLPLLLFLPKLHAAKNSCDIKNAYYNIVCSRFEFWCTTKNNVLTYEAICKNISLEGRSLTLLNPTKIMDIEIYTSNIPIITPKMFSNFSNSVRLYIQTGNTKEIQANAFQGLFKLDWLIMKNNKISIIQPKSFIGLSKLNVLNLNLNNLTELKASTFEGLDSLQYLSLKENQIKNIEAGSFKNLKKLGVLFLNDNQLTKLGDLADNIGLRIVWFQNNKIENIPDNFFKNKPLLREILLDNNKIDSVHFGALNSNISINNNQLNELMTSEVQGATIFDLSFNNISSIPANSFHSSPNLIKILLNNNDIDLLHEDSFHGLSKLTNLCLDNNQINALTVGIFQDLKSLLKLNLSYNKIETIESGIFTGLSNLEILDLSYNELSSIQISAMYSPKNLQTLYLQNNNLETLDIPNLLSHVVNLKEIDIDNNHWLCDWLSKNLLLLDSKNVSTTHGENMKTANVFGIFCYNMEPTQNEISIKTNKIINNKVENALHSVADKTSSGLKTGLYILIICIVLISFVIVFIVLNKFVWKRKIVIRKVQSNETISYKIDFEENE